MQLMTRASEEGVQKGLGWINGETVRLIPRTAEKIPNMGWRDISVKRSGALLSADESYRYYFVHSYGVQCADQSDVVATVDYAQGCCACLEHGHLMGVQFHPEKSHRYGMALFRRFEAFGS
jgi:glutamine amidotransferase